MPSSIVKPVCRSCFFDDGNLREVPARPGTEINRRVGRFICRWCASYWYDQALVNEMWGS